MQFFTWVWGLAFTLGVFGLALIAIGAALGFAHPALDFFNHLQPLIFGGTLVSLLSASFFVRAPQWRKLATAIAATGFLASAIMVVPDAVALLSPRAPLPDDGRPVYKLLTHNVFGLNYDAERIARAIAVENPDIVALQEYFPEQRDELHAKLIDAYPHFAICRGGKRANIAIYAKLEFEAELGGACMPDDEERTSRIAAHFGGDGVEPFTIVTTHLDWPAQVSKLDDGKDLAEGLQLAFARQRGQFADLSDALTMLPGPLLIAADFNSTSWSYALREFENIAGLTRHDHTVLTFPTRFHVFGWRDTPPILPLDHVMSRAGIEVHELHAGDPAGSDHRPLVALFSVNR